MSFWKTLGKIAGIAAPIAAAPFTGGTSLLGMLGAGAKTAGLIGTGLGVAGKLAGGAANQRAQDRGAQAEYNWARIPIQNSQALQQSKDRLSADQARMRQIGSADMLGSMKPPTDPRARLGGGGQMSPETLQMMRARAMNALESGSDVPQMQTMPNQPGGGATGMDSFLRTLQMAGTGLGAMQESGLFRPPAPQEPQMGSLEDFLKKHAPRQEWA